MLPSDEDMDRLDDFADGALAVDERAVISDRLNRETGLAAALKDILTDREWRRRAFASLEPTDAECERFADRVMRMSPGSSSGTLPLRFAASLAACIAIGFFAGWFSSDKHAVTVSPQKSVRVAAEPKVETVVSYQVALTDENGRVTAVQNFDSLEKAREFSQDLGQWQERQRLLRENATVLVADRF